MLTPFFTIEPDCMPDARLRLVDAWEAWGVPHDQQLSWWVGLCGVEEGGELDLYQHGSELNIFRALAFPYGGALAENWWEDTVEDVQTLMEWETVP